MRSSSNKLLHAINVSPRHLSSVPFGKKVRRLLRVVHVSEPAAEPDSFYVTE
jgi:hypothetical protein